jgi:DNA helicase II / ATP-dependent DNA helicase PcrA
MGTSGFDLGIHMLVDDFQIDFGFFLKDLGDCLDKGRGFSLFNADAHVSERFTEQCCQQGLKPLTFRLSSKETLAQNYPEGPAFVIVIQDLPYADFLNQAAALADRLIFPLWFKRTAICFFSSIGRDAYDHNSVNSEDLHKNYSMLINGLLSEQILSLLDRANCQFPSPESINSAGEVIILPPVEEMPRTTPDKHGRLTQAQARQYEMDMNLDPSQRKAVESTSGPTRVLAPAGSGKTKTLVNHILYLLNQGVPAEKILALAFNKKARDEMQARLERNGVYDVKTRTFHSLGYEIVRTAFQWNFSGPTVQTTVREFMQVAIHQHTDLPPLRNKDPLDAFLDGLRRAKMELSPLDTLTVEYGDRIYPFEPIFYSYLEKQVGAKFLDFDDMIYLAVRALLQNRSLRHDYQSSFEYVLVDEFQDLNQAQLLLMQILALPENNIFAVGDDDQMIYGFRGAEVRFLIEFDKRFPVSVSHVLNINYRSSRMIVRHSGWLINNNLIRVKKDIQPGPQNKIGTFEISGHASIIQQAEFAAGWLAKHKRENNLSWRDYAVLFRYNTFMFPVAMALDLFDIPHTPVSGQHLFQTAVGQDVYAYLSVILECTKARQPQLERILKRPNKYFSNRIIAQARNWDTLVRLPEIPGLQEWEQAKLLDFIGRLEQLSKRASMQPLSASECLQVIKTEFGLGDFYREQVRKSDDLDQANDEICFDVMTTLAEKYKTVAEFYQFICKSMNESEMDSKSTEKELSPQDQKSDNNLVHLSSIHKAKGMEFQVVVYFNLSKSKISQSHIEEERRIAYVGVTRPKNDLLVTFSSGKPSDFLLELAQNPQYKEWSTEALAAMAVERRRRVAKETYHKERMETEKGKVEAVFDELVKAQPRQRLAWLNQVQAWRINQAEQKISRHKEKIRAHEDEKLLPLIKELSELEEEINARKLLGLEKELS